MKWKISLGQFSNIRVYIHPTFFLLLIWVALSHWAGGSGLYGALGGLLSIMSIFLCVVLHEFGHALTAKKFGIATRDIILLPIGGVARLERMPRDPLQELLVSLAGPAVNLIIAAILYVFLAVSGAFIPLSNITVLSGSFIERLMAVNIFLMIFNLLPAFPMDGGRILRASLAMKGNYLQATRRAVQLGQGFSILFGLVGLMIGHPILVLIAFFIWAGAAQEKNMAKMDSTMEGQTKKMSKDERRHPATFRRGQSGVNCHFGHC